MREGEENRESDKETQSRGVAGSVFFPVVCVRMHPNTLPVSAKSGILLVGWWDSDLLLFHLCRQGEKTSDYGLVQTCTNGSHPCRVCVCVCVCVCFSSHHLTQLNPIESLSTCVIINYLQLIWARWKINKFIFLKAISQSVFFFLRTAGVAGRYGSH